MNKKKLFFYHTDECHLCQEAESLLGQTAASQAFDIVKTDIALDDTLFERYGTRIPVLSTSEGELNWPFSLDELSLFLKCHRDN